VPNTNGGNAGTVSVLINAADWGGGPPRAPSTRGEHRIQPVAGQLAVALPESVVQTNLAWDLPTADAVRSAMAIPEEAPAGEASQADTWPVQLSRTLGLQTRDTDSDAWGDPVVDVVGLSLLT
jgi:hypothetical protein